MGGRAIDARKYFGYSVPLEARAMTSGTCNHASESKRVSGILFENERAYLALTCNQCEVVELLPATPDCTENG
jgi:hypothetical protein